MGSLTMGKNKFNHCKVSGFKRSINNDPNLDQTSLYWIKLVYILMCG